MQGCPEYSSLGWLTDTLAKACDPAMNGSILAAEGGSSNEDWEFHCSSGPSLVLKKGCLHRARLGYTPLVEVNQAINAWSF